MTEVEAQHKIDNLKRLVDLQKDEREGLARDKKDLLKKLSEAQLDLKKLKHEKERLLAIISVEIKRRVELESKLFFFNEDSKGIPF